MKILLWLQCLYSYYTLPFLGSLITAGASLLGGMMGNNASAKEAARNRDFQSVEAQENRDFQKEMSSTAHQREVEDLRLAGLNPILSGTGGMGASTPSGSAASGSMATQQDIITPAVASARESARTWQDLENKKAEESYTKQLEKTAKEQQHNLFQDTDRKAHESGLIQAQTATEMAKTNTELQRSVTEMALQNYYRDQGASARALAGKTSHESRSAKVTADVDEKMRVIERAINAAGGATSAVRNLMPR